MSRHVTLGKHTMAPADRRRHPGFRFHRRRQRDIFLITATWPAEGETATHAMSVVKSGGGSETDVTSETHSLWLAACRRPSSSKYRVVGDESPGEMTQRLKHVGGMVSPTSLTRCVK